MDHPENRSTPRVPRGRLRSVMLLAVLPLWLPGCSPDVMTDDDVYVPTMAADRFPINVTETSQAILISVSSARLLQEDKRKIQEFARQARRQGVVSLSISYPAGSKKAAVIAREAESIVIGQGIRREAIHKSRAPAGAKAITLSFRGRAAVTAACGEWSENMTASYLNEPYPDQGCASQNNVAAMVANPDDFEKPRETSPVLASSRKAVLDKHQSGQWMTPRPDEGFTE